MFQGRPQRDPRVDNLSFDMAFKPETNRWESTRASFDLASMSTLRGLFFNTGRPDKKSDEMLSADFLNDLYPELEKSFQGPVSREFAEYIIERDMERKRLQKVMQSGPGGASQWILNTGAAFGASMVDPFEVGASMLAGAALGAGVKAFRAGRLAGLLTGSGANLSRAQQVQRAAAYNLAGSAAVEPLLFVGANRMHEERTIGDAMISTLASTVMGTALDMSFRIGGDVIRDFSSGRFGSNIKTKIGMAQVGREIDIDVPRQPLDLDQVILNQRINGVNKDIKGNSLSRGAVISDARGIRASGSFYSLSSSGRPNQFSREAGFSSGSTFMTNAAYFHSDPAMSLSGVQTGGKMSFVNALERADIGTSNLIDGDLPMRAQTSIVRSIMKEMGAKENQSFIQALNEIPVRDQNRFEELIKQQFDSAQIDGFISRSEGPDGPIETIALTNQSKIKTSEVYDIPDQPQFGSELQDKRIQEALGNPENQAFYDKDGQQRMEDIPNRPRKETERSIEEIGVDEATLQDFQNRKDLAPEVKRSLEELQAMRQLQEKQDSFIKSAIHCGGN